MTDKQRLEELEAKVAAFEKYSDFCVDLANRQEEENARLREALEHIKTRKMSCYLSIGHMNVDFIETATKALEEIK